ncbi:DegT/DnrJ/EryC1/StrS family aminotransferase [Streptomyces buecherae]|uniref:DegT/DnrJ/EryC1/StrS family aminotransferase n=1 Tax=Streptomyces buecherae TaxID=2763006 RepID=UPI001C2577A1|nr:DegT/DnrJ/EryC1/StrS family aminotransferase [Streptomyces buecherae]
MGRRVTESIPGSPGTAAPTGVPFFTQAASFERLWPSVRRQIEDVLDSGVYSNGPKTAELEAALRTYTGARHAIAVGDGTDALVLLLRAAGIGPGDEVVVPAFASAAPAASVALVGARPVFADVDPLTYGIDPASVEKAITARTRAVLPAHVFCQPADLAGVTDVAARHGLLVLEDGARSLGMRWGGVHTGLIGAGGAVSLCPTTTLGALGDAGLVLTRDDGLAARVRALRDHGRTAPSAAVSQGTASRRAAAAEVARQGEHLGTNAKMDDVQAAVLLGKLAGVEADIARRAELAAAYTRHLRGAPGVRRLPEVVRGSRACVDPVFSVYAIEVDDRDGLVDHLARAGISTEAYPRPPHLQPCFADLGHREGDFPNAEEAAEHVLALPLYPDLTSRQVADVCAAVRSFAPEGAL